MGHPSGVILNEKFFWECPSGAVHVEFRERLLSGDILGTLSTSESTSITPAFLVPLLINRRIIS